MLIAYAVLLAASPQELPAGAARFDLLDNGSFTEELPDVRDRSGSVRIPWWRTTAGADQLEEIDGLVALRTAGDESADQPIAAFAPWLGALRLTGEVRGKGVVRWTDGLGREAHFDVGGADDAFTSFEVTGAQLATAIDEPSPRLVLALGAQSGSAWWRDLRCEVALPAPTPAELRAEIVAELDWIVQLWLEHGIDRSGPRTTGFLGQFFDVLTGESAFALDGGLNVFFELLMDALEVHDDPSWRAAFEAFMEDFLTIGLHPETGVPQAWDVEADVAQDGRTRYPEVAATLRFLIDVHERGPTEYRDRALAAARKLGATALARGVLPDGEVAPKYRVTDGAPSTSANHIRRLALPAQLARLGRVIGDERYLDVALDAVANFEYSHYWPGSWQQIDPGFDDNYGNYGAHAVVLWRAYPEQPMFRRIALSGWEYYAPRWRDALRLGGNVAADQVRCWKIVRDICELDTSQTAAARVLLRAAARSHFKGEQYGNGAWGDVTIFAFHPKDNLQVGDLTGTPQNLLSGLASLYEPRLVAPDGIDLAELRAQFTAVLRSSAATYKRPYGYLSTRREQAGLNMSMGSLRLAVGLVEMLRRL